MSAPTCDVGRAPDGREYLVFRFPVPAKVTTLNERLHWRDEARRKKAWRGAAQRFAEVLAPANARPLDPTVRWECEVSYPSTRPTARRDPHNWVRTTKWIIDGLVLAGVLADDDRTHLRVEDASFHNVVEQPNVVVALMAPGVSDG